MYQDKERMMNSFIKRHPENEIYLQAKSLVEYILKEFKNTNEKVLVFKFQDLINNPNFSIKNKDGLFILYAHSIYFFNLMGLVVKLKNDNYLLAEKKSN